MSANPSEAKSWPPPSTAPPFNPRVRDGMTLSSLHAASKSAVDTSELAVKAAEDALAAARTARDHARAALEAVQAKMDEERDKAVAEVARDHASDAIEAERQSSITKTDRGGSSVTVNNVENTKCKSCNQTPCLSGQFLTETIIKNPVGLRVKATGGSWAASKLQGKCGTVVSYKHTKVNNFLNILWEGQSMAEHKKANPHGHQQFTYFAKGEPKFMIECPPHTRLPSAASNVPEESQPQKSLCSNCKNNPCLHGTLLNNVEADYEGINVQFVVQRSDKIYGHIEKQYLKRKRKTLAVKWVNQEEPKYFSLLKDGKFVFKYFCNPVGATISDVTVGDSHDLTTSQNDVEDESEDDDSFTMLSTPSTKIVDIEDETEKICHGNRNFSDESKLKQQAAKENKWGCKAANKKQFSKAVKHLEAAVKHDPNNELYKTNLGSSYHALGWEAIKNMETFVKEDLLKATAHLEAAKSYNPNEDTINEKLNSIYTRLGNESIKEDEVLDALKYYEAANDCVSTLGSLALLGKTHHLLENYTQSIVYLERAIAEFQPNEMFVYFALANAHRMAGNFTKSMELFKKSIDIGEKNNDDKEEIAESWMMLTRIHLDLDNLEAAKVTTECALKEHFSESSKETLLKIELTLALKENEAGVNALDKEDYLKALQHLEAAKEHDPDNNSVIHNLAYAHHKVGIEAERVGDYSKATKHLEEATNFNPEKMEFYLALAMAHFKQENFTESAKIYKKCIAVGKKTNEDKEAVGQAWIMLAINLDHLGNLKGAKNAAENALQEHECEEFRTTLHGIESLISKEEKNCTQTQNAPAKKETTQDDVRSKLALKEKELGNDAFRLKDFKKALKHYRKAISHDPTEITFVNNVAAVLFQQEKYEECIKSCQNAIDVGKMYKADSKHVAKAWNRAGRCHRRMKNLGEAKDSFENAIEKHYFKDYLTNYMEVASEMVQKLLTQGNQSYESGKWVEAVEHFSKALQISPQNLYLLCNRAASYFKAGELDKALLDSDAAIKALPKVTSDMSSYRIASDPWFHSAHSWKYRTLILMGRTNDAQKAYREIEDTSGGLVTLDDLKVEFINKVIPREYLMSHCPNKQEVERENLAEKIKLKGNDSFGNQNYEEAVKFYTEAIEINPRDARIFSNRAAALLKLERFENAIDDCNISLNLDPHHINAFLRKAAALKSMFPLNFSKYAADALQCYAKVLQIDGEHEAAQKGFLKLYSELYTPEDEETFRVPNEYYVRKMTITRHVPVYFRARKLAENGEYEEALKDIRSVLSMCPKFCEARVLKAEVLEKLGNHEHALDVYKKILEIQPNNRIASDGMRKCKVLIEKNAKGKGLL